MFASYLAKSRAFLSRKSVLLALVFLLGFATAEVSTFAVAHPVSLTFTTTINATEQATLIQALVDVTKANQALLKQH